MAGSSEDRGNTLRPLGRTGLQVSRIGYGMWGMTGWAGSNDTQSRAALRKAVSGGIQFFDSAQSYGDGRSDLLLGELVEEHPQIIAASKVPPADGKWPASADASYASVFGRDYVLRQVDEIRRSLRVDTVPLLQFHVWDDAWADAPEFRATVELLLSTDRIAHFGLSLNRWHPWNGLKAIETGLVSTVQVVYNIFDQNPEDELFPACLQHGVGVIARVPLDEGSLGGQMTRETAFAADDWRARYFNPAHLAETMDRVDALRAALPEGTDLADVALRFAYSHPAVSTAIVGMRTPERVERNLCSMREGPLPPELLHALKTFRWDRGPAR